MAKPPLYIGCGCVVTDGEGRFLLVRETKAVARGRLALPAGGLEPDESLVEAAVREVLEETGLVVEPTGLLGVFHCPRTSEQSYGVNFVYEARVVGGEVTTSPEHPEVVWLTRSEIEAVDVREGIRGAHVQIAVARSAAGEYLDDPVTRVAAND